MITDIQLPEIVNWVKTLTDLIIWAVKSFADLFITI